MNREYYLTLIKVKPGQEILAAKTLAGLLKVGLTKARLFVQSTPVPILRSSEAEVLVFQQALEEVGATVTIENFPRIQNDESNNLDDQFTLERYYNELAGLNQDYNQLLTLKEQFKQVSNQTISSDYDPSEVKELEEKVKNLENKLKDEKTKLETVNNNIKSLTQKIDILKTKLMWSVMMIMLVAIITFFGFGSNIIATIVAVIVMYGFLAMAVEDK